MKSRKYVWLLGLSLGAFVIFSLYFMFFPVIGQKDGAIFYLKPGISRRIAINDMAEQGVILHPELFKLYAYFHVTSQVKTGEYLFPQGSTHADIWYQITHGQGLYNRLFTIVPGWTFKQVKEALKAAVGLKQVIAEMSDVEIMSLLGYPDKKPEGEFFPETYHYNRGNPDISILKRAIDLMQKRLSDAWKTRAPNLPYKDQYQALIAASLIEREAYLPKEQPVIAGVLVNRLNKGMLLQFDPTVIYGMGDRYQGTIYRKDLEDDNAYNTYIKKGLPPTPIGMPGMDAIESALHPEQHEYLYFVARGDGSHQFSKTLAEHEAAVAAARKQTAQGLNKAI